MTGMEPAGLHTQLEFQHRAKAEPSRPGPFCSGSRPRSRCFLFPLCLSTLLSLSYLPPFLCHPLSVSGAEVVPGCLVLFIFSASISLHPSLAPHPCSAGRSSPTLPIAFRKSPQANPVLTAVERHSLALQGFIKPSDERFLDLSLCILPKLNPGSDFPSLRHKDLKIFPGLKYLKGLGDSRGLGSCVHGTKGGQFFRRGESLSSNTMN